jgi:hypothetical protein
MASQTMDLTKTSAHPAGARLPRWGEGAVFAIRRAGCRTVPQSSFGCRNPALATLDPALLEEFLASCAAAEVDIVPLDEARRRLLLGAGAPHFISITIDGALRGLLTGAAPVLRKYRVPYTVFISPVQHDEKLLPWWLALEALVHRTPRLSLAVRGQVFRASCHRAEEKAEALDNLIPLLMAHPEAAVRRSIQAVCDADGIDLDAIAAETLLSWDEIRELAQDPLVTIGQLASECHGAGASAYDSVRESLRRDRARLGEAAAKGIRHIGFSAGWSGLVEDRDLEIVSALGFSSASLPEGGVAIGGGASRCAVLPRICLNNSPDTMLEAQALAGAGFCLRSIGRAAFRTVTAA